MYSPLVGGPKKRLTLIINEKYIFRWEVIKKLTINNRFSQYFLNLSAYGYILQYKCVDCMPHPSHSCIT